VGCPVIKCFIDDLIISSVLLIVKRFIDIFSSFLLMSATVRKTVLFCTIHYKGQKNAAQIRPDSRQRPRRSGGTRRPDQPGKGKAADLVMRSAALSKSLTLAGKSHSRKP
jgi:hypothetical protein